jgi:hypothetical protein
MQANHLSVCLCPLGKGSSSLLKAAHPHNPRNHKRTWVIDIQAEGRVTDPAIHTHRRTGVTEIAAAVTPSGGLLQPLGNLGDGRTATAGSGLYGAPGLPDHDHTPDTPIALYVLRAAFVAALSLCLGLALSLDPRNLCAPRQPACRAAFR